MLIDDRWLLPEGIEEIFPDEALRLEALRRGVLELFGRWGYRIVIPPMIEFLDSLLVGTAHDLELQTFKLIDPVSGRLIGIRADMTPQVARIDARMSAIDYPTRLCYAGTVLHTVADHLERSRSPMQVGAELYGHAGIASDVEIIRLALETLAYAGLAEVHLDLGHVAIYRGLVGEAQLDPASEAQLFDILQRKDRGALDEYLGSAALAPAVAARLAALLDLNGPSSVLDRAREALAGSGEYVNRALAELQGISERLLRLFPSLPIHFDLAELRGYHYQTGVVFAAFVPGYGREVARGGRYDEIGKVFGRARPATGFSADLKVLLRLAPFVDERPAQPAIFAPAVDDDDLHERVRSLRATGQCVIQGLPEQVGGAREMGCDYELSLQNGKWELVPTPPST